MFGSISAWFWKYLGGITPLQSGWRRVRIAPSFGELCDQVESDIKPLASPTVEGQVLDTVEATLDTVAGLVHTKWKLDVANGVGTLNVSVPVDAEVVVPCVPHASDSEIVEIISGEVVFGQPVLSVQARRAGVRSSVREELGGVRLEVGAGSYAFRRQRRISNGPR